MSYTCSVVLVLHSFDIRLGKDGVFFERGDVVLVEPWLKRIFLSYPDNIIVVDFDDRVISAYFKTNPLVYHYLKGCSPLYLRVKFPNINLLQNLIGFLNQDCSDMEISRDAISFSCLAVFSSDKKFETFLFRCLNSIGSKVRVIIHSDISACWELGDISSSLHISDSLLKNKLKSEGLSFSKIVLEEKMITAENLLNAHVYSVEKVV